MLKIVGEIVTGKGDIRKSNKLRYFHVPVYADLFMSIKVDYWCDNFGIGLRKTSFHQRNCYKKRDDRCLIEVLNTCVLRKIIYFWQIFFNFPTTRFRDFVILYRQKSITNPTFLVCLKYKTCIKLEKLCKI